MKMKLITIILSLGTVAMAVPIHSMLGANGVSCVNPDKGIPTAADYVQDGLIAMWDGIENAGWGVHKANATIWKDLVGSRDFNLSANATVKRDSLLCNGFSAWQDGNITEYITIEIVLKSESCNGVVWFPGDSNNRIIAHFTSVANPYMQVMGGNNTKTPTVDDSKKSVSVTYHQLGSKINGYDVLVNTLVPEYVFVYNTWSSRNQYTTIGAYGYNSTIRPFIGQIFCIRLYDRALTDEEVCYNYEIDRMRFGL